MERARAARQRHAPVARRHLGRPVEAPEWALAPATPRHHGAGVAL
jgi:hypothetical protein